MGNLFDGLQECAQAIIARNMGYPATWTPSAGGPQQSATVLFNKPTQKAEISDEDYTDISMKMEYLVGDFAGLFESVRGTGTEIVNIAGTDYACYKVDGKFDGKTIIIYIQPAE